MHKDRHSNLVFIHLKTPALKVRVVVIKTGVNPLDRPEHTAFFLLGFIAPTRAGGVVVQVIQQATAVAVVQAGSGEVAAVLNVRRAAKTNLSIFVEWRKCRDDCLPLALNEVAVADQFAHAFQSIFQLCL